MESGNSPAQKDFPLHWVERCNWLLSAVLVATVWFKFPLFQAQSVLLGCLVANFSFIFLKRDLTRFLQGDLILIGSTERAKRLFYVKYYARLVVVALLLFILVSKHLADPIALLVGLSVVVLSIGLTVTSQIKKVCFTAKEV